MIQIRAYRRRLAHGLRVRPEQQVARLDTATLRIQQPIGNFGCIGHRPFQRREAGARIFVDADNKGPSGHG
jgi:hypothetical protein